ncbi:RNase H domain-containing protein [Caerostris extrusa]|uniref:RNase H domain-containing protein n=1 Tax=Caerostris extrusa TaxID=172846 RepID=A0AAV4XZJ3_CAEEX|nr:RNase H domain-containing protein [Caerostris extrusa]
MLASAHLLESNVEQHILIQCVDPFDGLPNVYFHTDLSDQVNKQDDLPVYLKQLAFEIINDIPADAIKMYTDGSKNEKVGTGSGIYIISNSNYMKIQRRNPDGCSVFRSKLIAINESLDYIATVTAGNEIDSN